ncbi:MAG: hypothetical protein AB1466_02325 [Actinomycetota bacterium]
MKRKLHDLKRALQDALTPDEEKMALERAEVLLMKRPPIKRIEGLIKRIIRQRGDKPTKESIEQIQNYVTELNLAFHLSEVKGFGIEIERKVGEGEKRVDITIFNGKNYYIEVKNINEPKYSEREKNFLDSIQGKLSEIKKPYYIDFYFYDYRSLEYEGSLMRCIKDRAETADEDSIEDVYFHYPNEYEPVLAFSFRKSGDLNHLELCLYGSSEEKYFSWVHKRSVIRGIWDAEQKFPQPGGDKLNILAVSLGGWVDVDLIKDMQSWYYYDKPASNHDERGKPVGFDDLFDLYDPYARSIGFTKNLKIDAFVTLKGKGFRSGYETTFYTKPGIDERELRGIFG